ncbi:hypothetical protein XM38_033400 [Halomicronema hongdechloris C2206]|uniref:Uncharacterized protein n=1 Tax=Halomicronema hongdechloris C2206 TaxID=1641165 RepID=A0A1Z3HQ07_9CYAN|nr:hypothetical protein XM38_033400 [Halomicronema hongdechloris C2206]
MRLGETVAARDSYERAQGLSPPGPGRTSVAAASVDLLIVIDNEPALGPVVAALSSAAEAAIAQVTQLQPLDLRLVWLGLEAPWPQTRCDRSVAEFLATQGDVTAPSQEPAQILEILVDHGGWRLEATRAIWILGATDSDGLREADLATASLIARAHQNQVRLHTDWTPRDDTAVWNSQSRLAQSTGGLSRTLGADPTDAVALLRDALLNSCQECTYRRLVIEAPPHCYGLDTQQLASLQSTANTTSLTPGDYMIRISQGAFGYWSDGQGFAPEPWVVLWIHGGRVINKQTGVEVASIWAVLNGYGDALVLRVLEPTHLWALFLDTYREDNSGQVDISILEMT